MFIDPFSIQLAADSYMTVTPTSEGMILDVFEVHDGGDTESIGTMGMTWHEWADFVIDHDPANA